MSVLFLDKHNTAVIIAVKFIPEKYNLIFEPLMYFDFSMQHNMIGIHNLTLSMKNETSMFNQTNGSS